MVVSWLVWVFQRLLFSWDFHQQPSQEFTASDPKKRKYPLSSSSLGENALLMPEVGGGRLVGDDKKATVTQITTREVCRRPFLMFNLISAQQATAYTTDSIVNSVSIKELRKTPIQFIKWCNFARQMEGFLHSFIHLVKRPRENVYKRGFSFDKASVCYIQADQPIRFDAASLARAL